ncbi:tetratricopeptide repeat protein [Streptomyces colonosanans]|uniref:tetratricopeptide repeat protein n=1 Tax=Streptomyces colonosanans TaxID=1428652 RepID=UPI0009A0DA44|nr:tetratricopeptide repeat protein [Streptomyces colonosanans]
MDRGAGVFDHGRAGAGRRPGRPSARPAHPRRGCRGALGSDHPDTLVSRNNLAGAYGAAGKFGRAIPLFEQNLTDCLRDLGEDHPITRLGSARLTYLKWISS